MNKIVMHPRSVYFLNGKCVGAGVSGSHQQFDRMEIIDLPSDHYDFIGPINVFGKTAEEIKIEAAKLMEDSREKRLTKKTIMIIEAGGRILIKRNQWYLGSWSNIAAGPDHTVWSKRNNAMEMFNLEWAFAIAKLYKAKVVVVYPKKVHPPVYEGLDSFDRPDKGIAIGSHTAARQALK